MMKLIFVSPFLRLDIINLIMTEYNKCAHVVDVTLTENQNTSVFSEKYIQLVPYMILLFKEITA